MNCRRFLNGVVVMIFFTGFGLTACQKAENDDHPFKSQEMALKKAKKLQKTLTEQIKKDAKRLQQASE